MPDELRSVRVYFDDRYRGMDNVWKLCNTFVLQKSLSSHSILHVFDKNSISTEKAEKALIEDGYFLRIAKGRVSAETQEWHFIEPSDPNKCKQLLKKIVDDPEFLRYYSKYTVLAPNGELLGRICDYITMGQA